MASDHNLGQLFSILLATVVVILTSLVVASSFARKYDYPEPIPGLLDHDVQHTTETSYNTPISPAPWLQWVWVGLFMWLLCLVIHAFISIFRRWTGVPVYTYPVLLPSSLMVCLALSCMFLAGWFVAYDRLLPSTSTLMALLSTTMAWAAYYISLHSLEVNLFRLRKGERDMEIWVHRIIVQNGLALLGQWTMFVAAFNVAIVLIHNDRRSLDEELACAIALLIIASWMFTYFITDITCLDPYTRYTATPYITNIAVVCACLFRQSEWKSDDVNFLALAGLMAFAFLSFMLKSACAACRVMRGSTCGSIDITTLSIRRTKPEDEGRYLLK